MQKIYASFKAGLHSVFGSTYKRPNKLCIGEFRRGSLLVEVLLGIALFALFVSASFLTLLTGQESSRTGSYRVRGVYYTEQGVESLKSIRDTNWDNLAQGKHGYYLTEDQGWVLSGSQLSRYNYNTYILIDNVVGEDSVKAHVRSTWKQGKFRSGATILSIELANWRSANGLGDWTSPSLTGSTVFPTTINFNDIIVYKDYAYVTSEVGSAGDGLYIFDVSDATNPTRVSSSFSLNGSAHKPVVYQNRLYVMVEDGSDPEIQAYSISSPTSLNGSTAPIATYNIPGGNNRGTALAIDGAVLYAGADTNGAQAEIYSFSIATGSEIVLLDELLLSGDPTVTDVAVKDGFLVVSTDSNTQEMIAVDISDPTDMSINTAYNASSVEDGYAVRSANTGYYLGRSTGASDEFILVIGSGGTPSNNPSKTYGANMGGSVNAMDMDPLGCYAFMATSNTTKELQIRSARYKTIDEQATENLTTGNGRGIFYDLIDDRLYLATESGFYIYDPGSTPTCL